MGLKTQINTLFDIKVDNFNRPLKYKARIVFEGNTQRYGESYYEVYAPVSTPDGIRILLALATEWDCGLRQFDFSTAYLNAKLTEYLYAYPPVGYSHPDNPNLIWLLRKSLYGAKQSVRNWNQYLEERFRLFGLTLASDIHYIWSNADLMLAVHVDDLILAYRTQQALDHFIQFFAQDTCTMNDLGEVSQFLGVEIHRDRSRKMLKIVQAGYVDRVLERFDMKTAHPRNIPLDPGLKFSRTDEPKCDAAESKLYHELLGVIGWKCTWTSPGLAFTHSYLSRFLISPAKAHLQAAKSVLRYMKFTRDFGPLYQASNFLLPTQRPNTLYSWADSDHGMCLDKFRSTSGQLILLNGAAIYWKSNLQSTTATSTTEAEYISLSENAKNCVSFRYLLENLQAPQELTTIIYQDNTAVIASSKTALSRSRLRHVNVRVYNVRELVRNQIVRAVQCSTTDQHADMCTKALPRIPHTRHSEIAQGELFTAPLFPIPPPSSS